MGGSGGGRGTPWGNPRGGNFKPGVSPGGSPIGKVVLATVVAEDGGKVVKVARIAKVAKTALGCQGLPPLAKIGNLRSTQAFCNLEIAGNYQFLSRMSPNETKFNAKNRTTHTPKNIPHWAQETASNGR